MPVPSPSRIRSDRFANRRTAFHYRTPLESGRLWLSLGALALAAAWLVIALFVRGDESSYSSGNVASVHAAWNNDCAACHRPHSLNTSATGLLDVAHRWHDFTCDNCHGGPVHHDNMKGDLPANQQCGECHHDHRGAGQLLTHLDDSACQRCHADLQNHSRAECRAANKVTSFVADHPEFRKLDSKRYTHQRKLKFSHSLHMTAGIPYVAEATRGLKLQAIPPVFRERYRGKKKTGQPQDGGDLVELTCASCHQLDHERAGDGPVPAAERKRLGDLPVESMLPPRQARQYMLPVSYDLHCKACHPLRTVVGDARSSYALDPPHRVQPAPLEQWLKSELTSQVTRDQTRGRKIEMIGGRLDPRKRAALEATVDEHVKGLAGLGAKDLYHSGGICLRCHDVQTGKDSGALPEAIVPPDIPTVWFEKSRFSHVAHRAMDCLACHPGKGPEQDKDGKTLVIEREPLAGSIAGIDSCRQCHAPTGSKLANGKRGGADVRHGCTDCHSYHNGANPLQGIGAKARDPGKLWSLEDWLRAGTKGKAVERAP